MAYRAKVAALVLAGRSATAHDRKHPATLLTSTVASMIHIRVERFMFGTRRDINRNHLHNDTTETAPTNETERKQLQTSPCGLSPYHPWY